MPCRSPGVILKILEIPWGRRCGLHSPSWLSLSLALFLGPAGSESKLGPFHGFHQDQKALVSIIYRQLCRWLGSPRKGSEILDERRLPSPSLLSPFIPHRFSLELQFFVLYCAELLGHLTLFFFLCHCVRVRVRVCPFVCVCMSMSTKTLSNYFKCWCFISVIFLHGRTPKQVSSPNCFPFDRSLSL